MNYFSRLANLGSKLGINPSTLSGAVDVLIVEQEDGSYVSTPFYVRFGKLNVIRPAEKVVDIAINGKPVPLMMKLGEEGEAFFLEPASDDEDLPPHLSASPLSSSPDLTALCSESDGLSSQTIAEGVAEMLNATPVSTFELGARSKSMENVSLSANQSHEVSELTTASVSIDRSLVAEAAANQPTATLQPSVPAAHTSNTSDPEKDTTQKSSWWRKWSSTKSGPTATPPLPVSPKPEQPDAQPTPPPSATEVDKVKPKSGRQQQSVSVSGCSEIYLDDLDDEKAKVYLYSMQAQKPVKPVRGATSDSSDAEREPKKAPAADSSSEDESGHDSPFTTSGVHSPAVASQSDAKLPIDFSIDIALCDSPLRENVSETAPADFEERRLTSLAEFMSRAHDLINDDRLVVRYDGRYLSWRVAAPLIVAHLAFGGPLPRDSLLHVLGQVKQVQGERRKWFNWSSSSQTGAGASKNLLAADNGPAHSAGRRHVRPRASNAALSRFNADEEADACLSDSEVFEANRSSRVSQTIIRPKSHTDSLDDPDLVEAMATNQTDSEKLAIPQSNPASVLPASSSGKQQQQQPQDTSKKPRCRKTLQLGSAQIAKLNLRRGVNKVTYSVTTQFQGTARCICYAYLWRYDDKVVISDIDGTITKSDVMGHVVPRLPLIGNDWAQPGVAQLFTKIVKNGYRIAYLSARAIGQSAQTREYLRSVKQGDHVLPDGPILLSPTSLAQAFHREVIERRPEVFKIDCLRQIQNVFGPRSEPLYSGYGNRVNDVFAYSNVGIPRSRIFTVNPRSQIVQESIEHCVIPGYGRLCELVDHLYPPLPVDDHDEVTRCLTFAEAERLDANSEGVQLARGDDEEEFEDDSAEDDADADAAVKIVVDADSTAAEANGKVVEKRRRERHRRRQHLEASLNYNQVVFWRDQLPELPSTP